MPTKPSDPLQLRARLLEGGFILLTAVGIFLLVALITYNIHDPGWSTTGEHAKIQNLAGITGAWFADLLLFCFGFLAYTLPLTFLCVAVLCLQGRWTIPERTSSTAFIWSLRFLGGFLFFSGACGLVSLHVAFSGEHLPGSSGGMLGEWLLIQFKPVLNVFGSSLVFSVSILIGLTLATGLSWLSALDKLGRLCFVATLFGLKLSLAGLRKTLQYLGVFKDKLSAFWQKKVPDLQKPLIKRDVVNASPVIHEKPAVPQMSQASQVPQVVKQSKSRSLRKRTKALPDLNLLAVPKAVDLKKQLSQSALETLSKEVEAKLLDFNIQVKVVAVYPGPVIIRLELELAAGIKASRVSSLANDLARALSVTRVRVVEVIPGKAVVGLEVPNVHRELVCLREILQSTQYRQAHSVLTLGLGKDISGVAVVVDLTRMPHLLVAGTTGSGKSVGVNAMLLSLLYKANPEDVRLILIDPKMLELSIYDGIPHLLTPVVTDMKDAAGSLRWCVAEMERRYQLMAAVGVRNLAGFNEKVRSAAVRGKPLVDPLWEPVEGEQAPELTKLPFIVVIIDEFADLMMVVGKKVEELIARIAQKARAAGIHMILATQRPSVDVITGLIKANVPTRIAFQVSSRIDSRTILDQSGAEQLLGSGDMLYLAPGTGVPIRVHGAFVSDEEVHRVVGDLKARGEPDYVEEIFTSQIKIPGFDKITESEDPENGDPLYDQALMIVTETRKSSISYVQRRLKIGYNRAARLIEAMEAAGVLSPVQQNGLREVLAPPPVSTK